MNSQVREYSVIFGSIEYSHIEEGKSHYARVIKGKVTILRAGRALAALLSLSSRASTRNGRKLADAFGKVYSDGGSQILTQSPYDIEGLVIMSVDLYCDMYRN